MNPQDPKLQEMIVGIFVMVWIMGWKAFGLWKASKNNQKNWFILIFVLFLVINTFGLLEIIYLVFFQTKGRYWEDIKQKLLATSPVTLTKK